MSTLTNGINVVNEYERLKVDQHTKAKVLK